MTPPEAMNPAPRTVEPGGGEAAKALAVAAATIDALYQWVDQIEHAGGATSISGVAKCHAFLASMKKNRARVETLVMEPARAARPAASLFCSFCGKSHHEVRKLIAGPTVLICDECVELCGGLIREETEAAVPTGDAP